MLPQELKESIINYLAPYGISSIRLFGSFAKGNQSPNSDLDLLVDFNDRLSLLKIVKIERELSEKTGFKIDLLTKKAISPFLIERIYHESIILE
ncbi:MAG: nucleotidyltransferase family protein [Ignavibacteriae bacterium]|nr:nucleotidyltransferase family protein [Ignavibacteriota bacterium]